jgi:CheY-like chemotaxis protein
MATLFSNNILIVDTDSLYVKKLKHVMANSGANCFQGFFVKDAMKVLKEHDIDLVICNYYLPDGLIHDLIGWAKNNIKQLPIFISIGQSIPGDENLLKLQLIADVWERNISDEQLLSHVSRLVFNQEEFRQTLLELLEPRGLNLEFILNRAIFLGKPIEIMENCLLFSSDEVTSYQGVGHLRLSLYDGHEFNLFNVLGTIEIGNQQSSFNIHKDYQAIWNNLRHALEEKQIHVSNFLGKVTGL